MGPQAENPAVVALRQALRRALAVAGACEEPILAAGQDGRIGFANASAAKLLGKPAAELIGMPLQALLPDAAFSPSGAVEPGESRLAAPAAESRVSLEPSHSEGECIIRLRPAGVTDKLACLADASSALLGSLSPQAVLDSILKLSRQMVDSDGYAVWRTDPAARVWRIVSARGVSDELRRSSLSTASAPVLPAEPLVIEDVQASEFLALRRAVYAREGIRSLLIVPLRFHSRDIGTIAFYFRRAHRFPAAELQAACALANLAAAAIGAADLYKRQSEMRKRAQDAQWRAAFLARAGSILASSLDYETTLASVARLAVPHIADWCVVDILEPGGTLRHLAVAHKDPAKIAWASELQRRFPDDPSSDSGAYKAVRTGKAVLVPEITEAMLARAARDPEHLRILREIGFSSYMCVPLATRGRTLGAISFICSESGRRFSGADAALAKDLARRAAMAVDNARLYAEARQALADLQASETRFRRLADSGVIGVAAGRGGRITDANDAFVGMLGYTRADFGPQGLSLDAISAPGSEQADRTALAQLMATGACKPYQKTFVRKDGAGVPALVGAALVESSPFRWISYVIDLTERQHLEERLRESQKLESIGLLAGGIAHDFNNLLTGILGNASLALEDMPEDLACRGAIANVVHAAERAADLTRQLLAYSGRGQFVVEPLDLSALVREIATLLHATLAKKVTLALDLGQGLPRVEADPAQMQQLAMNLVINAAEAIGDRPGTVAISTSLRRLDPGYVPNSLVSDDLAPGEYVVLEVRDNGAGMDEETRAHIFDPFFTTKFTGRGLGLAAALGIVRGHHGDIRVRSAKGTGSIFEVLLPALRALETGSTPVSREDLRGRGTVLVVDDEDLVRQAACAALEKYGYGVLEARDGAQALEVFREHAAEIALLLLDMTMPVMNGDEALAELRKHRPDLPVVVSTGFTESEAQQRFAGAGISAFLEKPYTASRLAEILAAVLSARPLYKEIGGQSP